MPSAAQLGRPFGLVVRGKSLLHPGNRLSSRSFSEILGGLTGWKSSPPKTFISDCQDIAVHVPMRHLSRCVR